MNEKRGHKFEEEEGRVSERTWREKRNGRNVIKLQTSKISKNKLEEICCWWGESMKLNGEGVREDWEGNEYDQNVWNF